jgi:HK97 family phage portal protein
MSASLRNNGTELWWSYRTNDGSATEYPDTDIIHLQGLAFDGIQGEGIIKNAARSLLLSDSVEEFGADFFKNGIHPGGTINTDQTLSGEAKDQLKKSLQEWAKRENWHRTLVLDWGLKWNKITFSPEEAQFLGSREFQDIEIARWLNLPRRALKLADADGLRNVEQISIELVKGSILPRYIAFEQELRAKLFTDDDSYFAEFVVEGLLRGDAKSRAEVHKIYREIGVESANEIRRYENLNPRDDPGGDEYWSQPNLAANKSNGGGDTGDDQKTDTEPDPGDDEEGAADGSA